MTPEWNGWWRRWQRYGVCPYCAAGDGQPCEDQRWLNIKHPRSRWCRHPHPERQHVLKPTGSTT